MQLTSIILGLLALGSSTINAQSTSKCTAVTPNIAFQLYAVGANNTLTNLNFGNINGKRVVAAAGNNVDTFTIDNSTLLGDNFSYKSNVPAANKAIVFSTLSGNPPAGLYGLQSSGGVAPNSCYLTYSNKVNSQFYLCQYVKQTDSNTLYLTYNGTAADCTATKIIAINVRD